jgi:PAS domain S-box-containing protein
MIPRNPAATRGQTPLLLKQLRQQPLKVPLRLILTIPFMLLMVGTVGLVAYLGHRNGQRAVEDLVDQLTDEVSDRVTLKLDTYLDLPYFINQVNQDAIELEELDLTDLRQVERHFWRQVQQFQSVVSIAVGTQTGEFTGIGRPGQGALGLKVGTAGQETNGNFHIYATNNRGERVGSPEVRDPYDPRQRPWYIDTVKAGRPVWSQIYSDFSDPRLVITANQPFYDGDNRLQGVLSIDLLLSDVGAFLQTQQVGDRGQVFIMERSGLLVASSTAEEPFTVSNGAVNRVPAADHENPLIRLATAQLLQRFGDFSQITTSQQFAFQLQPHEFKQWQTWEVENAARPAQQSLANSFFLRVTPLQDERGLDWLIVLAVPAADFTAQIDANTRTTMLLSAAALLGAIALGLLLARWINRPIQRLSQTSRDLAAGNWQQDLEQHSPIAELQVLTRSFQQTSQQLQQLFNHVSTALQESEEKFTKVFRTCPDPIGIVTPDGRYLEVNDAFIDLFGYSKEEVIGHNASEIGHWIDQEDREQYVRSVQTSGRVRNQEYTFRKKTGECLIVLFSAESIELQGQQYFIGIAKEITDRKQLELALQRSEAKLKAVLNSAIAAITSVRIASSAGWTYDYWSEGCEVVFGYTAEELMANPTLWRSRVFPADREPILEFSPQRYMVEGTSTVEYRFDHKEKGLCWISAHLTSRPDEADGWMVTVVAIDITDRKQADEALRQSEAALRRAQQVAHVGSWEIDVQTGQVSWSEESFHIFGWDTAQSEPSLNQFYELIHPDDRALIQRSIEQTITTKIPYKTEFRILQANGVVRSVEARGEAIADEQGQVIKLIGTNLDVTERKQTEEALRQSEATKNQILKAIPDLILWMKKDGTCIDLIEGGGTTNIYPYSQTDSAGKGLYDLLPPDLAQIRLDAIHRTLASHEAQVYEQQLLIDGKPHHEEVRVISVGEDRILVIVRDITDRKRAEAALLDSEERFRSAFQDAPIGMALIGLDERWLKVNPVLCDMLGYSETEVLEMSAFALVHPDDVDKLQHCIEYVLHQGKRNAQAELRYCCHQDRIAWGWLSLSLVRNAQNQPLYYVAQIQDITERQAIDRMKNEFISIVSHELRTPLTAIRGFLGLLDTGIYDNKPEKAKHMIGQALTNSDRLVRLVNDILDLERLSSGKAQLVMERCCAAELMERAVAGVQPIADQAAIALVRLPTSAQVWADADAILQTLTNLLSNAIKFSPADSTITLSAQGQPAGTVLFAVADRGRGIPPDKLESIFGRFQQVDVSDARQKGGTGLGLAICQSIVQQHGGEIWVDSTLGAGSTFYFTLPLPSHDAIQEDNH